MAAEDINPFISLALGLKKRGHNATIITSEVYEKLITDLGLPFISCGRAEEYYQAINHPDCYNHKKNFKFLASLFKVESIKLLYRIIANFDPKNTVLVVPPLGIGARIAHEQLKFPLVSICLQPTGFWSSDKPSVFPTGAVSKVKCNTLL